MQPPLPGSRPAEFEPTAFFPSWAHYHPSSPQHRHPQQPPPLPSLARCEIMSFPPSSVGESFDLPKNIVLDLLLCPLFPNIAQLHATMLPHHSPAGNKDRERQGLES
ncbi:hypothetical protein NMY22_g13814 [Coprinellus aureogranulatus]|nr:hypothetical protein NMY22_g13814 [Coprinellus aureogranulatus]